MVLGLVGDVLADHGGRSTQLFHARHGTCALAMVRPGGLDLFRLGLSFPAKLILVCHFGLSFSLIFLWGFWMDI